MGFHLEHCSFPTEIWEMIIKDLRTKELKSISLSCRTLYLIARKYLWWHPKFKRSVNSKQFKMLSHLPIKKINLCALKVSSSAEADNFVQMFIMMDQLEVYVDKRSFCKDCVPFKRQWCEKCSSVTIKLLRKFSPFITIIVAKGLNIGIRRLLSHLSLIKLPRLQSIRIDDHIFNDSRLHDKFMDSSLPINAPCSVQL